MLLDDNLYPAHAVLRCICPLAFVSFRQFCILKYYMIQWRVVCMHYFVKRNRIYCTVCIDRRELRSDMFKSLVKWWSHELVLVNTTWHDTFTVLPRQCLFTAFITQSSNYYSNLSKKCLYKCLRILYSLITVHISASYHTLYYIPVQMYPFSVYDSSIFHCFEIYYMNQWVIQRIVEK